MSRFWKSTLVVFSTLITLACKPIHAPEPETSNPDSLFDKGLADPSRLVTPIIQFRCAQFAVGPGDKLRCGGETKNYMDRLDFGAAPRKPIYEIIDNKFVFYGMAAFRKILAEEVESGGALRFLERLKSGVVSAKGQISLWDTAVKAADGSQSDALRHLAVLLQDTSDGAQVAYMRTVYGKNHLVPALIEDITKYLLVNGKRLKAFPPGIPNLDSAWYHFYVPAYAARLAQSNQKSDKLPAFVAFLFNAEYELQQIINEDVQLHQRVPEKHLNTTLLGKIQNLMEFSKQRVQDLKEVNERVFGSWAQIQLQMVDHSLHDVYSGYAGAYWGLSGSNGLIGQSLFLDKFKKNPNAFQKKIFENIISSKN